MKNGIARKVKADEQVNGKDERANWTERAIVYPS
jgi:hypothetical protein